MAYVPGFANDLFISYSHLDNQTSWITEFQHALRVKVEEVLGAQVKVWRDPRLGPASSFSRELDRELRGSAILLPVVSPAYRQSTWCQWELHGFYVGERRAGALWVDTKCRVIQIVKRPELDGCEHLGILDDIGVAPFFTVDEQTGHASELTGASDAYDKAVLELASEVAIVLRGMRRARTVFVGTASAALADRRERIVHELKAREYRVIEAPAAPAPRSAEDVRGAIRKAGLAILFHDASAVGNVADAEVAAGQEREAATAAGAKRIVVARGEADAIADPGHELATAQESANVEWLIEPEAYTLLHTVLQTLDAPADPAVAADATAQPAGGRREPGRTPRIVRIYMVCDRQDHPLLSSNRAREVRDYLLTLGFEVKVPLAEDSDPKEFSRDNRNKLRQCDGVLVFWGAARQAWFDQRLGELLQARGWRHGRDFAAVGAYVADPANPVKQNYETREVDELIKQFGMLDYSDERLQRLLDRFVQKA